MPQSFTCLYYHIIFSTKHRERTITPDLQLRLYEYIGGIIRGEHGVMVAVGGVADHVHILARLAQQPAVADVVRVVKANASKWLRETFPKSLWNGWQTGYGAFTVSHSKLAR